MAQKILKVTRRKPTSGTPAAKDETGIVLVGTYKTGQLKWIGRHGLYNYPMKEGDAFDATAMGKVGELWLYAGAKGTRHCYAAALVRKMTREEWLEENPTYAKLGEPTYKAYYVFKAKKQEYGALRDGQFVVARADDFAKGRGQTQKIKQALKRYKQDGTLVPLAAYLPQDLVQVPKEQLRVCDPLLQMDFLSAILSELSIEQVAQREHTSVKAVRRLVASGQLRSVRRGSRYFVPESALDAFKGDIGVAAAEMELADVHFVPGWGIDPEQRDMCKRGKRVGAGISNRIPVRHKENRGGDNVNWQNIGEYWENPGRSQEMTFVDLFCGAGGLSKGLEMSGIEGICGLDWFDEAGMTYSRNFNHPFINGDIKLPENKARFYETVRQRLHGRQLSVVAGGFPCQGFSMAGNRIVDDPRNSLYKEMIEIVEHLRPEFVICENVKGLRSMLGGAVEDMILANFRAIGYEMNVTTLCAADYYTPQKRERVIFIGNRLGLRNLHPRPILTPDHYCTTRDAIEDLMDHPEDAAFNHVPTRHSPQMVERMRVLPEGQSLYAGYSDAWKKCPWNEASCTIKENHGGVNVHPRLPRVLTAREMARLQSFPDDFVFAGKKAKQLVQIGNAVPPFLGKAIGLAIRIARNDLH